MTVRRTQHGFTLIEILAALVVLGLVVGGLAQAVRFGLDAWHRAAAFSEAGDTRDAIDRSLRRLIAAAHPGTPTQPAPFAAGPNRLTLVTMLPALPGMPEQQVEALLEVDGRRRLVLRWRPHVHAGRRRLPGFTEAELLRGVSGMELGFWRADLGWVTGWDAPDLPALVRIRLALGPPGSRPWPDIVVAPGLDRP